MPLTSKNQAFDEFGKGELHSGKGGPVVTNRRQAVAIALSVQKRKQGGTPTSKPMSKGR